MERNLLKVAFSTQHLLTSSRHVGVMDALALLYSIAISANLSGSVLNLSQAYNQNCFCFINSFTNLFANIHSQFLFFPLQH